MSANIGGFPTGDSRGRTLAFYAIPAAVNRFSNLSKPLRALLYGVAPLDPSALARLISSRISLRIVCRFKSSGRDRGWWRG